MAAIDATVALGAGTVLALGAALVVLGPLWNGAAEGEPAATPAPRAPAPDEPGTTRAEGVSAVEALREIEFDRATGKLSEDDYVALKTAYTRDALAELRAAQGRAAGQLAAAPAGVAPPVAVGPTTASPASDPVEEALRAYRARRDGAAHGERACVACGPRPESDATFCSSCGRFLAAHCPQCGAACDQEGQRFCGACGTNLAAAVAAPEPAGVGG
jgi:predicted nucleic acid-binding Zn ribbon protein